MFLVLTLALLLATALLINAVFPARGRLGNWLALACLIYGQVVLLAEALSMLTAISAPGYLIGHAILFGASLALWWRRGRPDLVRRWWVSPAEVAAGLRRNRRLALFAAGIMLLLVANGLLAVIYPTHVVDVLNYHLPRAYVWSQQHNLQHYPTDDYRQVEFPPNASLTDLWLMVVAPGSSRWMHLPQWLAGIVLALAAAALARLAGHGRAAAVMTGLVTITGTNTIMQMAAASNDLLTGATAACFVYFAFRFLEGRSHAGPPVHHDLLYAGLAFGLSLGTKLTTLFLLPGAGLALLGYGLWRLRRRAGGPILWLGVSVITGFVSFGSYNYALNWLDFGNPITSHSLDDASALGQDGPRPELYGLGANLIRYVYVVMDWKPFRVTKDQWLFQQNGHMFSALSAALGVNPQSATEFGFEGVGLRPLVFATAGFGPVIYLLLLGSPLAAVVFLWRARRSPCAALSLLLLGIAWGWLIAFAGIAPWSPYRTRYFNLFLPMLTTALIPWLYARRRWRLIWLLPVMGLCLWTTAWTTAYSFRRPAYLRQTLRGQFSYDAAAGFGRPAFDLLREALPPGATLGIAGDNAQAWTVMAAFPDFRYSMVPQKELASSLADGRASAVLGEWAVCRASGLPYLPLDLTDHLPCVLMDTAEAQAFMNHPAAVDYFRYAITGSPRDPYLELDARGALVGQDAFGLRVDVPTGLLKTDDLYIDVQYASGTLRAQQMADVPTCNDEPVEVTLRGDGLSLHLPPERYVSRSLLQRCQITYDYSPDLAVERVAVYAYTLTPQDTSATVPFANGLTLNAADIDSTVPSCGLLNLTTWWQAADGSPAGDLAVYLIDSRGFSVAEARAPLSGASDATRLVERRRFDVPCATPPGTYDVMLRVFEAGSDAPAAVAGSDSAMTLVKVGTITVDEQG